jgi:hypothetical protein
MAAAVKSFWRNQTIGSRAKVNICAAVERSTGRCVLSMLGRLPSLLSHIFLVGVCGLNHAGNVQRIIRLKTDQEVVNRKDVASASKIGLQRRDYLSDEFEDEPKICTSIMLSV